MKETYNKFCMGKYLSDSFLVYNDVRLENFLAPLFFKFFSSIYHFEVQEYWKDVELYGRNSSWKK
jgi:hypothetical protein